LNPLKGFFAEQVSQLLELFGLGFRDGLSHFLYSASYTGSCSEAGNRVV
jgi:hypothetical protein